MANKVGDSSEIPQEITCDMKNQLKNQIISLIISSMEPTHPDYFGKFELNMLNREVDFLLEVFLPIER